MERLAEAEVARGPALGVTVFAPKEDSYLMSREQLLARVDDAGPRREQGQQVELRRCEMDLRPGGKWRYVSVDADGSEFAFYGEYLEVTPKAIRLRKRILASNMRPKKGADA